MAMRPSYPDEDFACERLLLVTLLLLALALTGLAPAGDAGAHPCLVGASALTFRGR